MKKNNGEKCLKLDPKTAKEICQMCRICKFEEASFNKEIPYQIIKLFPDLKKDYGHLIK